MTINWLKVYSFAGRYGATIVVTLAIVAAVTGEGCRWRRQNQQLQKPVEAPPTKESVRWVEVPVPCADGQQVVYRKPSEKELKRLAEEYGFVLAQEAAPRPQEAPGAIGAGNGHIPPSEGEIANQPPSAAAPDPQRRVLGEFELGILPRGGSALSWLDVDGRNRLSISADPVPFVEWGADWEVGLLAGVGDGMTMGRAWAAVEPLRVGRFHLRLEGGGNYRGGTTDPYLMAGGVFRMGEHR